MVTSDFSPEVEIRPFRACAMKNMQYSSYLQPNRRHFRVLKEIRAEEHDGDIRFQTGSGNTVFCTCAMKNMQYSPYLWPNRRNFRVIQEIGVEEHDGDVIFFTGSGNTAVSRMRNASGRNYWNSSFIIDVAMGQIPCSTERICQFINIFLLLSSACQILGD